MTSVAQSARRTAGIVRNSSLLETLTRGGFVGYGLLHLAVGWIALQIAFGHATQEGSQSGVFSAARRRAGALAGKPYGQLLLVAVAAGFGAIGVYCFFQSRYRKV